MQTPPLRTAGLVLAAGAGTRYGQPKALVHDAGHSWLRHAVDVLIASGCSPVIVVLGARGTEAAQLLAQTEPASPRPEPTPSVLVVQADDWAEGLSASLRAGLRCALDQPDLLAVAVVPVDVPDLTTATIARMLGAAPQTQTRISEHTLRQARFAGRPGHPVVIGRAHWAPLIAVATGDTGAGPYLRAHDTEVIECGDLGTGRDVDRPR
ncbi:nucleotidyltransferase family protein [Cryobacterium sp. PH29-G1]|uniref:nucleotidyltransferase family protein n=1 Tax=Cryobacterium sp. PH29-G1 TaxID=3046211 RepID=UPI0024BAEE19|nr:nucleotidyltransferase family protein [Cryobacterium sp. PH29-G1]MDJ0348567.1 nucleotidyltransferase family protein [Cryobacterium sp. PH29-G1]